MILAGAVDPLFILQYFFDFFHFAVGKLRRDEHKAAGGTAGQLNVEAASHVSYVYGFSFKGSAAFTANPAVARYAFKLRVSHIRPPLAEYPSSVQGLGAPSPGTPGTTMRWQYAL